jgi:hypothetical protein
MRQRTNGVFSSMTDKLSDKEIERRKKQAELNAAAPKPHENFLQAGGKGKPGGPKSPKGRMFRHQGR